MFNFSISLESIQFPICFLKWFNWFQEKYIAYTYLSDLILDNRQNDDLLHEINSEIDQKTCSLLLVTFNKAFMFLQLWWLET